jgi:hypothetical protein
LPLALFSSEWSLWLRRERSKFFIEDDSATPKQKPLNFIV